MTFAAPWALWGLALLAGPVLVHLLSRRRARRRTFPSLRFLPPTRLSPVSRRTLDDRALLALRLLIVLLAVLALARPVRDGAAASRPTRARVVVVDTSVSMRRATPAGTSARVEAGRIADSLDAGRPDVLRVETAEPALVLPAAAAWLASRGGGDLLVLTDAQRGTLVRADVDALPPEVGVQVRAIEVATDPPAGAPHDTLQVFARGLGDDPMAHPLGVSLTAIAAPVVVHARTDRDEASGGSVSRADLALDVHADAGLADAGAADAGAADAASPPDAGRLPAVARVFEDALLRDVLAQYPVPVATVPADEAPVRRAPPVGSGWIAVPAEAPVGWVRAASPLAVRLAVPPTHPAAAALVAAALDAVRTHRAGPVQERASARLTRDELAALERPASATASTPVGGSDRSVPAQGVSPARWLWALALAALAIEWGWRRRLATRDPLAPEGDAAGAPVTS